MTEREYYASTKIFTTCQRFYYVHHYGFLMTGVITAVNTGIEDGFIERWWHAVIIAWPIAFLIILMVSKQVQKTANKICSK